MYNSRISKTGVSTHSAQSDSVSVLFEGDSYLGIFDFLSIKFHNIMSINYVLITLWQCIEKECTLRTGVHSVTSTWFIVVILCNLLERKSRIPKCESPSNNTETESD